MRKVVAFSVAAAADLNSIWDYTAGEWGVDQAERYTDGIQDICNSLARGEKRGHTVDIRDGYLKQSVGRHLVFYRTTDIGIAVIRILHQRMDVQRHL